MKRLERDYLNTIFKPLKQIGNTIKPEFYLRRLTMEKKFKVKLKVLYEYNYKDFEHYEQAVYNWQEKGWNFLIDQVSSKDGEDYTILYQDGYNR
jgi:hypothetical protein